MLASCEAVLSVSEPTDNTRQREQRKRVLASCEVILN